jgi:predicted enzyme related to lactoylglutathione lyase
MKAPPISRIILYVRDMPKIAAFYQRHFSSAARVSEKKNWIALISPAGGCMLVLLQASKGHKFGQSCIKIVFDVPDVGAYKEKCAKRGLKFGPIHHGEGYEYANARDPAKNLIQISSLAAKMPAHSMAASD